MKARNETRVVAKARRGIWSWLNSSSRRQETEILNPTAQATATVVAGEGRGKKILIVDDNPVILKTTGTKLSSRGYDVMTANEGAEAIRLVRRERPNLVLMDIHLPSDVYHGSTNFSDGFNIVTWLKRLEGENCPPIIFITGDDSNKCRERVQASGAAGVFAKPLDHDLLLNAIHRTIEPDKSSIQLAPGTDFQI